MWTESQDDAESDGIDFGSADRHWALHCGDGPGLCPTCNALSIASMLKMQSESTVAFVVFNPWGSSVLHGHEKGLFTVCIIR